MSEMRKREGERMAKVLRQGGTAGEKKAEQNNVSVIETVRSVESSVGSESVVGSVMGTPATVEYRASGTMVSPCPPNTKALLSS